MVDRFHWIVRGKLAGMSLPGRVEPLAEDLAGIREEGIHAIASLTEGSLDSGTLAGSGLTAKHFPIEDFGVPTIEQVAQFCHFVDEQVGAGRAVAVHCFAGLGRTGTLIACWLVRDPMANTEGILRHIRKIEPGFVQTPEQEAFIAVWESSVKRKRS